MPSSAGRGSARRREEPGGGARGGEEPGGDGRRREEPEGRLEEQWSEEQLRGRS